MTVKPSQKDLTAFGYSSSSSDEDEQLRKSNKSNNNSQNQKKKKKTKPPPQQSINKIWRHFSAKKFSRALSVLPFDPVPLPAEPERSNELLSAGYDRAVEECRRKVQKIIRECRRVNMRYRDPGWDVDWDLKMSKGNCLNYLGSSKFDINGPRLSSSTAVPKAVKRIHEIYEKPTFLADVNGSDIKQGFLGNCWLIASLSALANVKDGIRRICVEYDTRIGIYGFVFFRDGEWVYSIVDDKLYLTSPNWDSPSLQRDLLNQIDRDHEDAESWYRKTYQTGSKALFFGGNKSQNETWVPLIEKAYAKVHGDFASLIGGWIGEGVEDLSGGVTTELLASDILDLDGFWEDELSKVNEEFMFGCSTGLVDGGYGERNGIREGHAYVVMDARTLKTGERLVKLRNPWGKLKKGIWDGPWSDGSKEWTNEVKEELGHAFGNDSVFWLRYEDMLRKFLHFDRTRLFRDPDWRCCQRWIGVEVPWKAQYNEKFHITLTEESPLVIVLSQLDNRYYKGLHGQYHFRLHFRLHEQGSPGAEDYIVRSHGNYLMDRSVSIELPCMEPGKYSVFVSITAERDTNSATVEDVVKRECKKRSDHDKLASVGYAYDLAHSKGVAHLEQVAKLRKQSDQKKASSSRVAERRKLWEKRHTNREINKAQQKKNQEKAERRKEAKQEERKKKEEAEAAERKKKEETEAAERRKKEEAEEATERTKKAAETTGDKASQTGGAESEDISVKPNANEESDKAKVEEINDTPSGPETTGKDSKDGEASKDEDSKDGEASKDEDSKDGEASKDEDSKDGEASKDGDSKEGGSKNGDSKDGDSNPSVEDAPKPEAKEPETASPAPAPPADTKSKSDASDDGDSSDSPVEDWELLYSSDDMSRKPRMAPPPAPAAASTEKAAETDEEAGLPDPWNAVCIVGIRVYSKDAQLGLRVVIEGGGLAENGMGQKGAQDIDNAQMNGAGEREPATAADDDVQDEVEIIDGAPVVKQKVKAQRARGRAAADDENDDDRENEADSEDSDNEDPVATPDSASGDCTPQKRLG